MRLRLRLVTFIVSSGGVFAQTAGSLPAPKAIPASEIAFRSQEVVLSLATISKGLVQDKALADIQLTLKEKDSRLRDEALETRKVLDADPTSIDLRVQERRWRRRSLAQKAFAGNLTEWADTAIAGIRTLDAEEARWKTTLDSISRDLQSQPLQQIVARTIDKIRAVRQKAQAQVSRIVPLQERAAGPLLLISQVQTEIAKAEEEYKSRLLVQDTEPIWRTPLDVSEPARALERAVGSNAQMITDFARARSVTVVIGVISFLLVLLFLYKVRRGAARTHSGVTPQAAGLVLERPLAVAIILQLPMVPALLPDATPSMIALLVLVSVIPLLRILLHHAPAAARTAYLAASFYATGAILDLIPADSPFRRLAFLALLAAAVGALAWMMKTRAFRAARVFGGATRRVRIGTTIVILGVLAALAASLFGYLSLAQFLRQAVLLSSYLALLLVAWARVITVLFDVIVHLRGNSSPGLLNSKVGIWLGRTFRFCAFLVWLLATVNLMLLAGPAMQLGRAFLKKGLPGRLSGVTVGDLLACAAVLATGWILARTVRFVLREGVLSRIKLERGIADLVSNLVYYVLLLFVFIASLKAMGLDLSKLTLLTGAFGVGIGFGMQNVMNNFFSGLILQFERPIHTGDVIEVAGQIGEVYRIGIRSTTIRTPQGAELIVPNASLVSNNVVNWTVARSGWQISLPVLLGAGVAAENVIHLLVNAAEANPAVLRDPQPRAYLKNSGANGALFELSFAIAPSSSAERVRGNVAKAAFRALSQANVVPYQMAH